MYVRTYIGMHGWMDGWDGWMDIFCMECQIIVMQIVISNVHLLITLV